MITDQPRSEQSSNPPGFGPQRTAFGMSRDRGRRLEVVLAMRSGGVITVIDEQAEDVTEPGLAAYAAELGRQVAAGEGREFSDGWSASAQRSWVNLAEVTAYSVRPSK